MKIAFTVCNRYHLSQALVLAHSLKKHNPNHQFFLGWVDRMEIPPVPDWISVLPVESLKIVDWTGMEQRYFDFELIAACKPFFARQLLVNFSGCEELVYLSPTTQLFDSLDLVSDESAFLQLSPQRLSPIGETITRNRLSAKLDDKRILNTGMYQAGSWIMHPDGQEKAMLAWWCERMVDRGFFDMCVGMCLDQLWLNYLPIYHERVKTTRNSGWHYGLSRVPGSELSLTGGKYFVDKVPLVTLDFAGLERYDPIWSDHSALVSDEALWEDWRQEYRKALKEFSFTNDQSSLPFGKVAMVNSNRKIRTHVVRLLNGIVARIENFNWVYK